MAVSIGLAGAGRRAIDGYGPALAATEGARFAGVWAAEPSAAGSLASRHGVPAYHRFGELLDHCDGVVFVLPPATQAELATIAARSGKAVLLQKRIAADLAGAEQLTEAVATAGVVSQLALAWRYAPAIRRFLAADVPRTHPQGGTGWLAPPYPAADADPRRQERGVLLAAGPHLVDLLDAALGEVVDARARGDPRGWLGLTLEHRVGRFSECSIRAGEEGQPYRADVEIFGPGGVAAIDCAAAVGQDALETMLREFADAVEQHRPHQLDVRRGLHLWRVVDAADAALLAG